MRKTYALLLGLVLSLSPSAPAEEAPGVSPDELQDLLNKYRDPVVLDPVVDPTPVFPGTQTNGPTMCPFVDPCQKADIACGASVWETAVELAVQQIGSTGIKGCLVGLGITGGIEAFMRKYFPNDQVAGDPNWGQFIADMTALFGCSAIECLPKTTPVYCAAKATCVVGKGLAGAIECNAFQKECEDYKYTGSPTLNIIDEPREEFQCEFTTTVNGCVGDRPLTDDELSFECSAVLKGREIDSKRFGNCYSRCMNGSRRTSCAPGGGG